jgi:hypothetical protein
MWYQKKSRLLSGFFVKKNGKISFELQILSVWAVYILSCGHKTQNKEYCMKKVVCVLVLACVIMGGAFAQAKPAAKVAKNSIGFDLFRLFDGLLYFRSGALLGTTIAFAYERQILPHWSIGPDVEMSLEGGSGLFNFGLVMAAEGRYYPMADFSKFFLGATFGFGIVSTGGLGFRSTDFGLIVSLKTGYKLVTSKKLYLEPSLGYVHAFTGDRWQGGLRLGWSF